MNWLSRYLSHLKIGQKLSLGYGLVIVISVLCLVVSLGAQLLVDQQIARTTKVSATIDRLTDNVEQKINASRISLNEYLVQRALVGTSDNTSPEGALDALAAIHEDIAGLRAVTAVQDEAILAEIHLKLETLEHDLTTLEHRVETLLADLETLGDEESGQQGELLDGLADLGEAAQTTGLVDLQLVTFDAMGEAQGFLVDGEPGHISRFHNEIAGFRAAVTLSDLSPAEKEQLNGLADTVLTRLDALVNQQLIFNTRYNAFLEDTAEFQTNIETIRELGRLDFERSVAAVETAQHLARITRVLMFILLLILIPATVWLALEISRSITNPLAELVDVTQTLASGDLGARTNINQQDEVGLLAASFNQMADKLETSIQETRQASALAVALADTAAALTSTLNLDEVLDRLLDNASLVIPHDALNIHLIDPDTQTMRRVRGRGYIPEESESSVEYEPRPLTQFPLYQQLVNSGEPLVIPDTLKQPGWVAMPEGHWVRSYMSMPIKMKGKVIGVLNLDSQTPGFFTHTQTKHLETFADQVAVAIQNAHLYAEAKERAEQLQALITELERSNAELQSFAYVASHDLQEPLRKIRTIGDRLQVKYSALLDAQGVDYLQRMQAAAARMQILIQDLLVFSRVTTQAQPFISVNLNEVVEEVLVDLERQVEDVNGRIEVAELPVIEADKTQMRQLLQNLITNSLKFHRTGAPPVVKIEAHMIKKKLFGDGRTEPLDKIWCQLTITDNGIGFEEKHQERIFGVFQRLHGRNEYEGTGIGLSICRKIVERHGGQITAASQPDQGAVFTVTLPTHHQ